MAHLHFSDAAEAQVRYDGGLRGDGVEVGEVEVHELGVDLQ